MSSSDHRGVPQGNAAIIAAIIGGIAVVVASATGIIFERSLTTNSQSQTPIVRAVTETLTTARVVIVQPTLTPLPTLFSVIETPISVIQANQSYERSGVKVTLLDSISVWDTQFAISFKVENQSGRRILIPWRNSVVHVIDDKGHLYNQLHKNDSNWNNEKLLSLSNGQDLVIDVYPLVGGSMMDNNRLDMFVGPISPGARYLFVLMDEFAGMQNLNWRYDLQ